MSYPIIGLCGKAGAGKDTIANILVQEFKGDKMAFADKLKSLAEFFFPAEFVYGESKLRNEELWVPSFEQGEESRNRLCGLIVAYMPGIDMGVADMAARDIIEMYYANGKLMSARTFLQFVGTEVGRAFDRNIWVKHAQKNWDLMIDCGVPLVVISDVRFSNEAAAIKRAGGILCLVESGEDTLKSFHASETQMDSFPDFWFDLKIKNNKAAGKKDLSDAILQYMDPSRLFPTTEMTLGKPAPKCEKEVGCEF